MTELIVCRGIPGSGKSHWAKAWVAEDVRNRARVERDALRAMMHESVFKGSHTEKQIILVEYNMVCDLLKSGVSVVVSDTNLDVTTFNKWKDLPADNNFVNVKFSMQDFRDVDLNLCLTRNRAREGKARVPEEVILNMYNRYIKGQ